MGVMSSAYQTYNAMMAAGGSLGSYGPVDPALALSGLIAYGGRVHGTPENAMAFLRHAEGLLRGTEGGPLLQRLSVCLSVDERERGGTVDPSPWRRRSADVARDDALRRVRGPRGPEGGRQGQGHAPGRDHERSGRYPHVPHAEPLATERESSRRRVSLSLSLSVCLVWVGRVLLDVCPPPS